ncbi:hypothetical protein LEP1GSC137_3955 [Leptospira borgpetersenii str. Noumea 25]|uniref:Uncharacterized protein n=1 Tax=Leptospira borgpetersenii serovar Ballum TaxID=280505 RepID=A0A0S2ITI8_LEPBO|nr:hypothetical protein LBBP_02747 [Leptospira borgpetersenii serovar Ballum]EKQ99353.1 hypothetical protein LEP1GSC121_2675 [Leptospira borgpetersenii serovar Castellonis str. 200801910]EMO10735.1 hypothetical protein LEP1GSC137_3955 [Leptospira borgpetersenii str. Noumea 25]
MFEILGHIKMVSKINEQFCEKVEVPKNYVYSELSAFFEEDFIL